MKMLKPDYTPDHIPQFSVRIFAVAIDWFAFGCIFVGATFLLGTKKYISSTEYVMDYSTATAIAITAGWLILFPVLEGFTGQTIGKRIMKLRVLRVDFSTVSLPVSLLRHLFDVFDFGGLFGLLGCMVASRNKDRRRIGDLVAGTVVVKDILKVDALNLK